MSGEVVDFDVYFVIKTWILYSLFTLAKILFSYNLYIIVNKRLFKFLFITYSSNYFKLKITVLFSMFLKE